MGFNSLGRGPLRVRYWDGISYAIARSGYPVLTTRVHPTAGVARRAKQLRRDILDALANFNDPHGRVVILAHSMGGLDARYMITHLDMADRVQSLVTISSPHRGSPYYDYLTNKIGGLGRLEFLRDSLLEIQAFWDVTVERCLIFNQEVPDVAGVGYYSVTASCSPERVPLFIRPSYKVIQREHGGNDGLVSAMSARWGTELAHWPFHHFHLINWPMRWLSPASTEDIRPKYLQLLSLLRADGGLDEPQEEYSRKAMVVTF